MSFPSLLALLANKTRKNTRSGRKRNYLYPSQFVRDKFIFVHVPKCAGSNFLDSYLGFQVGHVKASDYVSADPNLFDESFSCAFVRHPIKRFVSAYNFINTSRAWPYLEAVSDLVNDRCSSLDDLARNIHLLPEISSLEWFKPQVEYVCMNGIVLVNRVFKTINYELAIKWLRENIGLSFHCDDGDINVRETKGMISGSQDISRDGIRNLERFYWKDFTLFGYY